MPRLKGYNYKTVGSYYVTICTQGRIEIFGHITKDRMHEDILGKIVRQCWEELPKHYRCELDAFVIMPNHIHAIITIPYLRSKNVAVGLKPKIKSSNDVAAGLRPAATLKLAPVSEIVRALKSFSAQEINKINRTTGNQVWQRGFYDHIIRTEKDLHTIREYIKYNPLKWLMDRNNRHRQNAK